MVLLHGVDRPKIEVPRWAGGELGERLRTYSPRTDLGRIVKDCFQYLPADLAGELLHRIERHMVIESGLSVVVLRGNGDLEDYGLVSQKVITDAGVDFLVDAFQNSTELENMKFHGFGSGSTAEAASQTDLVTEFTTEYSTNSTRPTGSTTEGGSTNIYRTVGTFSPDASVTVEEHATFDNATVGSGTMLDRSLTGGQALTDSDSLEATYDFTASSGG